MGWSNPLSGLEGESLVDLQVAEINGRDILLAAVGDDTVDAT